MTTPINPDEYFEPIELAAMLKIPLRTIYDWRSRGIGPKGIRIGRRIRYSRQAIDSWLAKQS